MRRALDKVAAELDRVLTPATGGAGDFYGRRYFEGRKDAGDAKASGYADYSRESSHADVLAELLHRLVPAHTTLDVGCARGFLVEALGELGHDASGCDGSQYAVNTAARGARGRLRQVDLRDGLPYATGAFELVTAFETLEHLPPDAVPNAIRELARVSAGTVVVTIPSFGPRPPLPSGWLAGKLRGERSGHYDALGPEYDGPIPLEDLARDRDGNPLEGHLTIASFRWWRRQFEAAGLRPDLDLDARAWAGLEAHRLAGFLDWMTFRRVR
jgi:SAM-dependent methyltransferase